MKLLVSTTIWSTKDICNLRLIQLNSPLTIMFNLPVTEKQIHNSQDNNVKTIELNGITI